MKTAEVQAVECNENNDRVCNYLERIYCWVLISVGVAFLCAISFEVQQNMHLHNHELRESMVMRNAFKNPMLRHRHEYFMP